MSVAITTLDDLKTKARGIVNASPGHADPNGEVIDGEVVEEPEPIEQIDGLVIEQPE